jgi:hypothetical protein
MSQHDKLQQLAHKGMPEALDFLTWPVVKSPLVAVLNPFSSCINRTAGSTQSNSCFIKYRSDRALGTYEAALFSRRQAAHFSCFTKDRDDRVLHS